METQAETRQQQPDSPDDLAAAADRLRADLAFAATHRLDALRATDYARLDRAGHCYLDYTGGSLYAESQLRDHMHLLETHVFGNPHSSNPSSQAMTELVEQTRRYIAEFFNADPAEYAVIFTPNASGALKLVGESYPFGPGDRYLLAYDNHNSVNGIREFAHARGAEVTYIPVLPPDLRLDAARFAAALDQPNPDGHNLCAYPAQSNFSGVLHSLDWIARAHDRGWDVLLDCAAFAPTNRLDLSRVQPDFVPLSFYKICGYPTGVGALLARRSALARLHRPWFAGGTITVASVQAGCFQLANSESAFEDGTVNYLSIPAVEIGLRYVAGIGVETIHARVHALTGWLLDQLTGLRHANGAPLVRIYGPVTGESRGGTLALNFYDPNGYLIDFAWVEAQANAHNISLRTGCFCNPGAGEVAAGLTSKDLEFCFRDEERMTFEHFRTVLDAKSPGAVRVSLGIATNVADVSHFVAFLAGTLLNRTDLPTRAHSAAP